MCTVTFLPLENNDFILTSSRDVPFSREKALIPKQYVEDEVVLFYPKDGKAGGSWIGTSDKKRLICLLNGGFENHQQKDFYSKSRGIIVKELLKVKDITSACKNIDLDHVEPFTLVIVEWDFELYLFEFVWDGFNKHLKILPQEPQIWSSSTLYTDEMKLMRKGWFAEWLFNFEQENISESNSDTHRALTQEKILNFHHTAGVGNPKIDVLMKRPKVGTVSITQVSKFEAQIKMAYEEIS